MTQTPREALREALLDQAEAAIARGGFQTLRARALTEAVGCALGALYTVFDDMDGLIFGVKARILDRLDARVSAHLARCTETSAAPVDTLLAMADAYLDFAWTERRQWETLFQHHLAGDRDLPEWYQARLAATVARIEGSLGLVLPAAPDPVRRTVAHTLFAATHGIVVLGIERKLGTVSRDDIAWRIALLIRAAVVGLTSEGMPPPPGSS